MKKYKQPDTVRTTLSIPADLLEATDQLVRLGCVRSRNEFVAIALRHEIEAHKRAEIDTAFAGMADDTEYQAESLAIASEFALAEWEAFQLSESQS
jgi:metal-responsive CopG/Arc/MetJ family transcriptional regulator